MAQTSAVDRILVSVIGNRFDAISKQIGETMLRTSRSPIFSEARDFVTAIFDNQHRLVAQTAYIPVLMGAQPYECRRGGGPLRRQRGRGRRLRSSTTPTGDQPPARHHDPEAGLLGGRTALLVGLEGHHADVGGGGVAGYHPGARSVWEECIRIPPTKLYIKGELNRDLWDTIMINVHLPFLVEGDLHCQVGACNIGERSLHDLIAKYGKDALYGAIEQIFDAAEAQMRAAIQDVPNGVYEAERFIDHDGINKDQMVGVRVALHVDDDSITFDFSKSDPQPAGYVNSTMANTSSASFLALFTSIGSEIRFNEGALRALDVVAPEGTVTNAREPAPVTSCTIDAAQAIIEAVWLALSQAVPDRVDAAWARWCAPATMGLNPRTGRPFGDIHFMAKGGGGASRGLDGWDHLGTIVCSGGLRSPDPELHELVDPYTVLQYEYGADSAGAGEWRGGMGTIYRWRIDAPGIPAAHFGGGNRPATAPFGLEGGLPAPHTTMSLTKSGGEVMELDTASFYDLGVGDVYEIHMSGGGGYGEPRRRPAEKVQEDVRNGLVSVDAARELYGVAVDPETFEVETAETAKLRG